MDEISARSAMLPVQIGAVPVMVHPCASSGRWMDIGDAKAREKASHALRAEVKRLDKMRQESEKNKTTRIPQDKKRKDAFSTLPITKDVKFNGASSPTTTSFDPQEFAGGRSLLRRPPLDSSRCTSGCSSHIGEVVKGHVASSTTQLFSSTADKDEARPITAHRIKTIDINTRDDCLMQFVSKDKITSIAGDDSDDERKDPDLGFDEDFANNWDFS